MFPAVFSFKDRYYVSSFPDWLTSGSNSAFIHRSSSDLIAFSEDEFDESDEEESESSEADNAKHQEDSNDENDFFEEELEFKG